MWTPDALVSEARPYRGDIWRVVENQYKVATVRITDTLEEQALLESILERSKPPLPPECEGLDFLLATPFRYAPYPFGSRFRRADQPEGAFYAAETAETAIAETAFHRLLFFAEAPATTLPACPVEHTAFSVRCGTERSIDLTEPPLDRDRALWIHPVDYQACQDLADSARAALIEAIRYESLRDPEHRPNIAVLSGAAFAERRPKSHQTWHIFPRPWGVQAWCESPKTSVEFRREQFGDDPRIAGQAAST
jgi:RES domain